MTLDTTDAQRSPAARIAAPDPARGDPIRAVVVRACDRTDHTCVALYGRVKVVLADGDDREIAVDEPGMGQFFDETALDGEPPSASVTTTEPSRPAVVECEPFRRYLASDPDAAFERLTTVIRRTRDATRVAGTRERSHVTIDQDRMDIHRPLPARR